MDCASPWSPFDSLCDELLVMVLVAGQWDAPSVGDALGYGDVCSRWRIAVSDWALRLIARDGTRVLSQAIRDCDLRTMRWAHERNMARVSALDLCLAAARAGHVPAFRWAVSHILQTPSCASRKWPRDLGACSPTDGIPLGVRNPSTLASLLGDVHSIARLVAAGCPLEPHVYLCAARAAKVPVLRWLVEDRLYEHDPGAWAAAAASGDVAVLEWMLEAGVPPDDTLCIEAARLGSVGVLRWAHSRGFPWDGRVVACAVVWRRAEVLEWARASDCEWDDYVSQAAAYAVEAGLPSMRTSWPCSHRARPAQVRAPPSPPGLRRLPSPRSFVYSQSAMYERRAASLSPTAATACPTPVQ